jgi:hypothetical protein
MTILSSCQSAIKKNHPDIKIDNQQKNAFLVSSKMVSNPDERDNLTALSCCK